MGSYQQYTILEDTKNNLTNILPREAYKTSASSPNNNPESTPKDSCNFDTSKINPMYMKPIT